MKKVYSIVFAFITLIIINLSLFSCKKKEDTTKYTAGVFPDSVYSLSGLNSGFDDYNSTILIIQSKTSIIFSTNRQSNGGQFDLAQGSITYSFDKKTGAFTLSSAITADPLYASIISKAITSGNDFGPYSMYSTSDGYDYLFLTSQNGSSMLDIFYLKYLPQFGTTIPAINGPFPAKVINSNYDDAYISFDNNEDSAYFCSNRGGNYDIYVLKKSTNVTLDAWMSQNFAVATIADSINTSSDEKCPFMLQNYMVFASNRPGGLGGYDIYYSVFRKGNWSTPVNLGPKVNSSSDEFRPVLGYDPEFSNMYMVFSSNKPGGSGGFDLYFSSFNNPK